MMNSVIMEYIIFADESYTTDSRFRGISAVSIPMKNYEAVKNHLTEILRDSSVSEMKWQEIKDARNKFCAHKIVKFIIPNLHKYHIRIDTLLWDTQDSRHTIIGRDDIANFERMFYHLLGNAMKKRKRGVKWHIRPDVRNGINWVTGRDCLHYKGQKSEIVNSIFSTFILDEHYSVHSFEEAHSHEEPLIQVADLFSGIFVFSTIAYEKYEVWQSHKIPSLFVLHEPVHASNREKYRFELLEKLDAECKKLSLGVSLKNNRQLLTYNPENPINFWQYRPQGEYDKAPTRK